MDSAGSGMTDDERDALERLIVEALGPIARRHGVDVTVQVHPPVGEPAAGDRGGAGVRFLFRR